ncbi:hypothetical protein ACU4GH_19045 [Bradyrhizobium betae]
MMFIQNLRIGTKLAITSALTIGLVALMIFLQMSGDADVQKLGAAASQQQTIAQNAAEAKASVRGMQIGIRDILTSSSLAEIAEDCRLFQRSTDGQPCSTRARWRSSPGRLRTASGSTV